MHHKIPKDYNEKIGEDVGMQKEREKTNFSM
jgi:hypothetical protein